MPEQSDGPPNLRRPWHRLVWRVLESLNGNLLASTACYFGGGTRIALELGEFRESVDIDFLCSESGSHDYTINRREAKNLGLRVEKCTESLHLILRNIQESFYSQMELRTPYDPNNIAVSGRVVSYEFTRAVIESSQHGAHHFVTAGEIETTEFIQSTQEGISAKNIAIQDRRKFDGWRQVS